MNLVALLIAPAVVTYYDNVGLRIGVTVVAVVVVVGAILVSKRRSVTIDKPNSDNEKKLEPVVN